MTKKLLLIALLLAISFTFHLKTAKVIEKVGDFLRKKDPINILGIPRCLHHVRASFYRRKGPSLGYLIEQARVKLDYFVDFALRSVGTCLSCFFSYLLVDSSYALANSGLDPLLAHIEYLLVFSDNYAFSDREILLSMIVY